MKSKLLLILFVITTYIIGICAVQQIDLTYQVQNLLPWKNVPGLIFFQSEYTTQTIAVYSVPATNTSGKFISVNIPNKVTFSNIAYYVTTADNSANLYNIGGFGGTGTSGCLNGQTAPLVFNTGALAGSVLAPGTGNQHHAISGTPITINPGIYCVGYTGSNSPNVMILGGDNGNEIWAPYVSNTQVLSVSSSAVFNSSITAPALSWQFTNQVWFVLY